MTLCDYGCGNEGFFILKNGKNCCSKHANSCPAMKKKNSEGLKKAHKISPKKWGHKGTNNWSKKTYFSILEKNLEKIMCKNSYSGNNVIKNYMLNYYHIEYKCSICNIDSWNNKAINFEVDHINGNNRDNRIENLRFACPNCHAQTKNYCGKGINSGDTKVTDEKLRQALMCNKNIRQALMSVQLTPKGGNYSRCYTLIDKYKIILSSSSPTAEASGLSPVQCEFESHLE